MDHIRLANISFTLAVYMLPVSFVLGDSSVFFMQVKAISDQLKNKAQELPPSKAPRAVTQALERLCVYTIDEFQV